ncbi:uncharacterized protein CPUR_08738 [Claviceps purpurea 20.1]|uniref:Uncharacterized protein n=1 Tax=Claviceps purpurea (strain 20.1) TaxID=1111077 RepID=M1WDH2_CLAP2|nr:uncharacterized protein CPUR_08738 [Claviceps purpurea 20.1]
MASSLQGRCTPSRAISCLIPFTP